MLVFFEEKQSCGTRKSKFWPQPCSKSLLWLLANSSILLRAPSSQKWILRRVDWNQSSSWVFSRTFYHYETEKCKKWQAPLETVERGLRTRSPPAHFKTRELYKSKFAWERNAQADSRIKWNIIFFSFTELFGASERTECNLLKC